MRPSRRRRQTTTTAKTARPRNVVRPAVTQRPAGPPEKNWNRPADIRFLLGATGSGKTWQFLQWLAQHTGPALVWDWKGEFLMLPQARSLKELARRLPDERRLRYVPDMLGDVERQFDRFCALAWTVQEWRPKSELLFGVDELQEVTTASHPPPQWRRIITQGRVLGFTVVGMTQRPALVDKTFTGNATLVRCGRLGEEPDAKLIGRKIGVTAAEIMELPDRHGFIYDGRTTERY